MKWIRISLRVAFGISVVCAAASLILWIASYNVLHGKKIKVGNKEYTISDGAFYRRVARDMSSVGHFWTHFVNYAVLAGILLVPLKVANAYAPRRPISNASCLNCGYDLRTHSQGQKCPECGRSIFQERESAGPNAKG